MEDRVVKVETRVDFIEKEMKNLRDMHKEEIQELKKVFKEHQKALEDIREEIRYFRQTHMQVKYVIIGGALVLIAKEVGIGHFLKILIGLL